MTDIIYARSALSENMWPEWCMIECLRAGTRGMRIAGPEYLPKWPLEDDESYRYRLHTSFLFNAMEQTIQSLAGRPFSQPLKLNDDIAPTIKTLLDDVDLEGRNLHNFAADVMRAGLAYGHSFILADYPTTAEARTQADLKTIGARPYLQHIFPQQILYWSASRVNGVMQLQEVRIWELVEGQGGLFSNLPVLQVRVLTPQSFQVWQPIEAAADGGKNAKEKTWTIVDEGPNTLGVIPLIPFYANRTGFMTSRPPLIDLAYLNVEHWQSASDQRNILHTARVPLLTVTSDDTDFKLSIGTSKAVRLPVGSEMKWVETTGAAISAGRQDLQDLIDRMQLLGAEMIIRPSGTKGSATEAAILDDKSESRLGQITQSLQDALNQALFMMGKWVNEPNTGTVEIYQDFGVDEITGTSETLLLQAAQGGKISNKLFFNELQRRGTISADADFDEDQQAMQAEGPPPGLLGANDDESGSLNPGDGKPTQD